MGEEYLRAPHSLRCWTENQAGSRVSWTIFLVEESGRFLELTLNKDILVANGNKIFRDSYMERKKRGRGKERRSTRVDKRSNSFHALFYFRLQK